MPDDPSPRSTVVVEPGPIQAIQDGELITGWGLVVEGYARVSAAIRRDLVEHCRLEPAEFEVLLRLSRSPDHRQTASQLAAEVSFSSGGFTKLADRLERAALVRRMPCQNDRRVVWIALTPTGQETIAAATGRHVEFLRRHVLEPLGEERFLTMSEAMRALRDQPRPN
jgi:DNA-binding MarR family transcriptional regulator